MADFFQKGVNVDLIVIGGFVSNLEFAQHKDRYQLYFRLKMGRLCTIDTQCCHHIEISRLPPGMRLPQKMSPLALEFFPSEYVSRDFALVFSKRMDIYGAYRRVIGIAGVKGNGTRGAANYLTMAEGLSGRQASLLPRVLDKDDDFELVLTTTAIHDHIDQTEPIEAIFNHKRTLEMDVPPGRPCELGQPCAGCHFGEILDVHAIVFDLDDTLVDTFSTLIAPLERQAAAVMVAAGHPATTEELLSLLLQLHREHPDRLEREMAQRGISPAAIVARRDIFASVPVERLSLDPSVRRLLEDLGRNHDLFLLTEGEVILQNRKIDRLGIRHLFRDIIVIDTSTEVDKEAALRTLLDKLGLKPAAVAVVGNRLDNEILAGLNLGLATVWVRHGEGSDTKTPSIYPDHTIESLLELTSVVSCTA